MNIIKNLIKYNLLALTMFVGQPLLSNEVKETNSVNAFNQLLNNNEIVVAEFYSPTCTHCKDFEKAGIFRDLSRELPNVQFVKISSVQGQPLHRMYRINGFPTFIIFKNGQQQGAPDAGFKQKMPLKKMIVDRTK